jgi:integrase
MKAGNEHRVPLSNTAMAVLAGLKREGDRVFPVSNMATKMALRRMDRGGVAVHGFRSTFSDWAAEQTNAPSGPHRQRQSGSRLSAWGFVAEASGAG